MKKLMIVAAVAAMAGAAVADEVVGPIDYVYDFTASVKSTGGKKGRDTKTNYKVDLGRDADGTWWWAALGFDGDNEAKAYVKTITDNDVKIALFEGVLWDADTKLSLFPLPAQNGRPCYTIRFFEITPAVCYRVAKSYKFKDTIVFAGCCGNEVEGAYGDYTINYLQNFGGMTYDKATKVEIDADVTGDLYGSNGKVDARIAGQGSFDKAGFIKSISGNIAGIQDGPYCPDCCQDEEPAGAFTCDNWEIDDTLPTAIFGTWSMKYNKRASLDLN